MKLNPLSVAMNYYGYLFKGNVHISGSTPINNAYPQCFHPFLHVKVDKQPAENPVRLLVKFKVGKLNLWQRKIMPHLGIPFFAGVPGFMEKVFLLNEAEKTFSGFYTWRSHEEAETYTQNYPGKIMAFNALPDTLTMEITPIKK